MFVPAHYLADLIKIHISDYNRTLDGEILHICFANDESKDKREV